MNYKQIIFLIPAILLHQLLTAQTETYTIEKTTFSSDEYDEFAPVFYRSGLVFCTNRNTGLAEYKTSQNVKFIQIYYADSVNGSSKKRPQLFSKELRTRLNDGPASFSSHGDTIYFSRNLIADGNLKSISSSRNKLGIYFAVREGNKWTRIREMRFNNEWYNISTPCISHDGKRVYFASDKPEGHGGSDLYYSEWKDDFWNDPVNLGPVINTKGNEAYPYISASGELFFSSDGHPGRGGKDIFYSRMKDDKWQIPLPLDPPVNSKYDDFALVADSMMCGGYFSSNREKSIDIYRFKTLLPQIFYTEVQKENKYCFIFSDTGAIHADTLNLRYVWDFGDGKKAYGAVVDHCFPGPGNYNVRLDLIDRASGNLFFSKMASKIRLKDFEQPYINSPEAVIAGESVDFDGSDSFLPGFKILGYSWDTGDMNRMQGESIKHVFRQSGEYHVKLGLKVQSVSTGIVQNMGVSKKIVVFNDQQEAAGYLAKLTVEKNQKPDYRHYPNVVIQTEYSAEEEFKKNAVFRIQLLSSDKSVGISSDLFRNIPEKYSVREETDNKTGTYNYFTDDEYLQLMYTCPAFREISGTGFKNIRISMEMVSDPVKKELFHLMKNYGIQADLYFDTYNRLRSTAYLMLDQVVILMNRNPGIRLEIGVHTDNQGSAAANLKLSQTRAQVMVNYLVNRGINVKRLATKGYGGVKPVASNLTENDRKQNRRIELRMIE